MVLNQTGHPRAGEMSTKGFNDPGLQPRGDWWFSDEAAKVQNHYIVCQATMDLGESPAAPITVSGICVMSSALEGQAILHSKLSG